MDSVKQLYIEMLPEKVRVGDVALVKRINVVNDFIPHIQCFSALIAALYGFDRDLYPNSVDPAVVRMETIMCNDTSALLLEGASFKKVSRRTTKKAKQATRKGGYGLKIMGGKYSTDRSSLDTNLVFLLSPRPGQYY